MTSHAASAEGRSSPVRPCETYALTRPHMSPPQPSPTAMQQPRTRSPSRLPLPAPSMQQPNLQQPSLQQPSLQQPSLQQPSLQQQPGLQQPSLQQRSQQPSLQPPSHIGNASHGRLNQPASLTPVTDLMACMMASEMAADMATMAAELAAEEASSAALRRSTTATTRRVMANKRSLLGLHSRGRPEQWVTLAGATPPVGCRHGVRKGACLLVADRRLAGGATKEVGLDAAAGGAPTGHPGLETTEEGISERVSPWSHGDERDEGGAEERAASSVGLRWASDHRDHTLRPLRSAHEFRHERTRPHTAPLRHMHTSPMLSSADHTTPCVTPPATPAPTPQRQPTSDDPKYESWRPATAPRHPSPAPSQHGGTVPAGQEPSQAEPVPKRSREAIVMIPYQQRPFQPKPNCDLRPNKRQPSHVVARSALDGRRQGLVLQTKLTAESWPKQKWRMSERAVDDAGVLTFASTH